MLLGSSSCPFPSPLPFSSPRPDPFPDPLPDLDTPSLPIPRSLSFSSPFSSPLLLDSSLSPDFDPDPLPWPRVRRSQSENDLQSFATLSSTSPARAMASSLLHSGVNDDFYAYPSDSGSCFERHWSRRTRHRRQSSLCSESSGLGRQDFIPEEISMSLFECVEEDNDEDSFSDTTQVEHNYDEDCRWSESRVCEPKIVVSQRPALERVGAVQQKAGCERSVIGTAGDHLRPLERQSEMSTGMEDHAQSSGRTRFYSGTSVGDRTTVLTSEKTRTMFVREGLSVLEGGGGGGGGGNGGRAEGFGTGGFGGDSDDVTDAYYQKMLAENPGHPLFLRNYAQFLAEVKKDLCKAEGFYERAILANPGDGEILAQYAKLIWDVYGDYDRASNYLERAVLAAPEDCYVLAAYASFLWAGGEEEKEEQDNKALQNVPSFNQSVISASA